MNQRRARPDQPSVRRRPPPKGVLAVGAVVAALVTGFLVGSAGQPQPSPVAGTAAGRGAAQPTAQTSTEPRSMPTPSSSARLPEPQSPGGVGGTGSPPTASRFGLGLLIADRGNGRLLIVDEAKRILWSFPGPTSLPKGQRFSADDAFLAPDGQTIVANDEAHQVIDRIDIATRKVIWQYGKYNVRGSAIGRLHTPDDAYPLANGDIVVADIRNCRILEIAPDKRVVRLWGRTRVCRHDPPRSFGDPNGDTPIGNDGLLITEIRGSRVVRLDARGHVIFDVRAPVRYPSDAQLDAQGDIVVVDYSSPGAIVRLSPNGTTLWRYAPRHGNGALDHPSLALPLPDGTIVVNDDFRHRVVVIDPRTNRIVWQYGRTGRPGASRGYLRIPDGICLVPVGTRLPPG
jgi:hypothetical protein